MQSIVRASLQNTHGVITAILEDSALVSAVEQAGKLCLEALNSGRKVLLAGNGGSAADCQHIAAELVSRFNYDRPGLPGIALTTDTSALLAIGNDYGFERVFARQLEALGQAGDIFIGISTSGNSPNILAALSVARALGIKTIGLTGKNGGKMAALCDTVLCIPSTETPRIQECHIILGHAICQIIEDAIFGEEYKPTA